MVFSRGLAFKIFLLLAFLSGCGGGARIMAVYEVQAGPALTPGTVQLLVQDRSGDFLGPEALAQDLFKASQNGHFDLTAKNPDGTQIALSDLTVAKLVWEAVRRSLALGGVTAITGTSGAKARVVVTVEELTLEKSGREVVAKVSLSANIDRPGLPNSYQTRGRGQASRTHLFGDQGGAGAVSEALSVALNNLNFSGLNNFQ
ncbi:MAG: hypothetical protein LBI10_09370 [Deltaproteobacteria bacterium]|jgi:hypothetical protein|nr:hypothetical protein [Deltaproteobacteria bacterium]